MSAESNPFYALILKGAHRARAVRRLPAWVGIAAALAGVILAAGLRELLDGSIHGQPYLLFLPVIVLVGGVFNSGAGFLAAALSILACMWFVDPDRSLEVAPGEVMSMSLFAPTAFVLAGGAELLRLSFAIIGGEARRPGPLERAKHILLAERRHKVGRELSARTTSFSRCFDVVDAAATQARVLGRVATRVGGDGQGVVWLDDFLNELGRELNRTRLARGAVRLSVDADRAEAPAETATALGLAIDELVTNAVKHGFPEGRGSIEVTFRQGAREHVLSVADDGIGPDEAVRDAGFGRVLLLHLARQLGGEFRSTRRGRRSGLVGIVTFPAATAAPPARA